MAGSRTGHPHYAISWSEIQTLPESESFCISIAPFNNNPHFDQPMRYIHSPSMTLHQAKYSLSVTYAVFKVGMAMNIVSTTKVHVSPLTRC